jgi:hypothetical protein
LKGSTKKWRTGNARLVGLRSGVAAVPATQATHPSTSSKVTLKVTNISAEPTVAVPEAVSSAIAAVSSKQPVGTKSVSASEQPGSSPSCPSNQPEQPSSPTQVGGCTCFYYGEQNH